MVGATVPNIGDQELPGKNHIFTLYGVLPVADL